MHSGESHAAAREKRVGSPLARAVLACSCAALWSAGAARADGIGIASYQGTDAPASAARVRAEVARVAREVGVTTTADPFAEARHELELGAVPRSQLAGFRRVRQLVDQGWRAYLTVEPSYAASRLSEARRLAESVLPLDGGVETYADVSLRLAVVSLDLGRKEEAAELFRIAAILDPDREVTLAEFSPDVVAAHEAAIGAAPASAPVRFEVGLAKDTGAGATTVELDGKPVGTAPLSVNVEAGQHVVVARAAGHVPAGRGFAVRDPGAAQGDAQVVKVQLDPDPLAAAILRGRQALAVGTAEASARVAVEGLVRYGDLDAVLLVASVWRRGAPALLGQWCRSIPASCGKVVEIGYDLPKNLPRAVRRLWESVRVRGSFPPTLLVDARLVSSEPAPGRGKNGGKGHGSSWWKWVLAGVGASAAIVVTGLLLSPEAEIQPVFTGDPCDFGGC